MLRTKLLRAALALSIALGTALITTDGARVANASQLTCSWNLIPGTSWQTWSVDHHFEVRLYGFPDMTGMVDSGVAQIYYHNEYTGNWDRMYLHYWQANQWGVYTHWVLPAHIASGFFDASRWIIEWPNGANGIYCPLA